VEVAISGPTVLPFTRTYIPAVVVQTSPFAGLEGAVPWGRLKPAPPVAEAAVINSDVRVPPRKEPPG